MERRLMILSKLSIVVGIWVIAMKIFGQPEYALILQEGTLTLKVKLILITNVFFNMFLFVCTSIVLKALSQILAKLKDCRTSAEIPEIPPKS